MKERHHSVIKIEQWRYSERKPSLNDNCALSSYLIFNVNIYFASPIISLMLLINLNLSLMELEYSEKRAELRCSEDISSIDRAPNYTHFPFPLFELS
jgi:hypothetical protein